MYVDQLTTAILSTVTGQTLELSFPSVEITKENIALAFPGAKIEGDRVDIYSAASVNQAEQVGVAIIHPVFMGAPVGDILDITDTNYDSSKDIMFLATPSSSMDTSFTRDDMIHLNMTLSGTPDPFSRMLIWGAPFSSELTFTPADLTGSAGTETSGALAASGGTSPYKYAVAQMPGWSVDSGTLKFTSAVAGVFSTLVYAQDADGKIATKLVTATIS
jgi:hypothetical protein